MSETLPFCVVGFFGLVADWGHCRRHPGGIGQDPSHQSSLRLKKLVKFLPFLLPRVWSYSKFEGGVVPVCTATSLLHHQPHRDKAPWVDLQVRYDFQLLWDWGGGVSCPYPIWVFVVDGLVAVTKEDIMSSWAEVIHLERSLIVQVYSSPRPSRRRVCPETTSFGSDQSSTTLMYMLLMKIVELSGSVKAHEIRKIAISLLLRRNCAVH